MSSNTRTRRVLVKSPEDIEPADVAPEPIPDAKVIEVQGNTYKQVGACTVCAKEVYAFVSGDPQVNTIGADRAVFAAYSHREKAGIYCQAHDPNAGHKAAAIPRTDFIQGDTWRPRA